MSGIAKVGAEVARGDALLMVHARTEEDCELALEKVRKGILIQ